MFAVIAQAAQAAPSSDNEMKWIVVSVLMLLINGGVGLLTFIKLAGGKGGERQIEPTQIAAIQVELKAQTATLSTINREVGEVKTTVNRLSEEMGGMHHRVGSISRDLAGTAARVDGLEKREHRK